MSTNSSRQIIGSFDKDSTDRSFLFDKNVGLFGNLNRLLSKAQSPIIRFLCQDDVLELNCLAHEVAYFERNPEVVMSVCRAHTIDSQDRIIGDWGPDEHAHIMRPQQSLELLAYHGCFPGNLSTVAARRAAIEQSGPFNESFRMAGDYEMWVRLCQTGNVADLRKKLIRVRDHLGRLSRSNSAGVQFVEENRRVTRQIICLLPEETRRKVLSYTYWRQNVLDTHHFIRCLIAGRFAECGSLFKIIGAHNFTAGMLAWLITANNHLYRPRPVFTP